MLAVPYTIISIVKVVRPALWRTLTKISPSSSASSSSASFEFLVITGLSIEGWLMDAASEAEGNEFDNAVAASVADIGVIS